MKNVKSICIATALLCWSHNIISMEVGKDLVVIPGQNGAGGQNLDEILPRWTPVNDIHHVKTPFTCIDLGQSHCISFLEETLQSLLQKQRATVVHASSQATATVLNYFAHVKEKATVFTEDEKKPHIKALILESVLLTGNSAIEHIAKNRYGISFPGAYYILPFLTRLFMFPFYAPAGLQACFSCDHLPEDSSFPKDFPIIILHAPQDPELSFRDSQALYAYLKHIGRKNVYFIPVGHGQHVNMLEESDKETKALQAILDKHYLYSLEEGPDDEALQMRNDLSAYQPNPKPEWLQDFHDIRKKEIRVRTIDATLKGALALLIAYGLYTYGFLGTLWRY